MEFCNLKLPNRGYYEGYVKKLSDGKKKWILRDGLGVMYIFDKPNKYNFKHIGSWEDDQTNGLGICIYQNGDHYYGNFQNGKRNGWGTYISRNFKYEGEWSNDLMNGYGHYNDIHGKIKNGHWKDDLYYDIIDIEVVNQLLKIKNLKDNSRSSPSNFFEFSSNEKFSELIPGSIVEIKSIKKIGFLIQTKGNGWCVIEFLDSPTMKLRASDIKVILRP